MCCMMSHQLDHGPETMTSVGGGAPSESPLEILRRRYALGEITHDQLEEMKAVLGLTGGKAVGAAAGSSNPWEAEHHG
jgi:uncharacterized membrane protein